MPGSPQSNAPPWNEADSFRETALLWIDDPEDREVLRQASRLLYDLAVEASRAEVHREELDRAMLIQPRTLDDPREGRVAAEDG
jgi:hypothetical protein